MGRKRVWPEDFLDELLDHMPASKNCPNNFTARSLRFALYRRAKERKIEIVSTIINNVVRVAPPTTFEELGLVD